VQFGISTDKPVVGDYDSDGKANIAVYRPSSGIWYLLRSSQGFTAFQWGKATDIPRLPIMTATGNRMRLFFVLQL